MPYVITDACVKDYLCVDSCATDAIHPRKDEPGTDEVTQLFINPEECIDCGTCITICESNAIFAEYDLPAEKADFAAKNAAHFGL
ncbi:MAG TPA: ferredoxin family protein [Acidisarcina sp.]|nr:ferredoxin family protein [Acidisarcina sp.]